MPKALSPGSAGKGGQRAGRMEPGRELSLSYQGREIHYRLIRSRRRSLGLCLDPEAELLVRAPLSASQERVKALVLGQSLGELARSLAVRQAVQRWYRRQVGLMLPQAAYFARVLGLAPPSLVQVRKQKRRWGSCNSKG